MIKHQTQIKNERTPVVPQNLWAREQPLPLSCSTTD